MEDLETLLPPKTQNLFADGELEFYRDSTSGNYTKAEMKARVKALKYRPFAVIDDDTLMEVENKIIRRAWDLGLLPKHFARRADDAERDHEEGYDLEYKAGNFGDTTVTAGFGSTEGKIWKAKPMNTFERGPHHRKRGGSEAGGSSGESHSNLEDAADGDPLD